MIPALFFIFLLIALATTIIVARNMMQLISTDTLIDGADTLLGDAPVRTTHDKLMGGIRKHIIGGLVVAFSSIGSIICGIAWIVQATTN